MNSSERLSPYAAGGRRIGLLGPGCRSSDAFVGMAGKRDFPLFPGSGSKAG